MRNEDFSCLYIITLNNIFKNYPEMIVLHIKQLFPLFIDNIKYHKDNICINIWECIYIMLNNSIICRNGYLSVTMEGIIDWYNYYIIV